MSFIPKSSYSKNELIDCSNGKLFTRSGDGRLPSDNMLMFDEIVDINDSGGEFNKGSIIANLNINPDLWFFDCHFKEDPVMPGCLGLDAMWQLLGFYLGWLGGKGSGRALSVGSVKFSGQILPKNSLVSYSLNIKRVLMRKLVLGIADGKVICDGIQVYEANDIRVGLFENKEIE